MRGCTRFHADKTGFEAAEQFQQLVAANLAAKHGAAFAIDAMNLEDVLRDIQTDGNNLHQDGSCSWGGAIDSRHPGTLRCRRVGGRPPHQAACWDWGPACMARPYSRDLRERVVRAVEGGLSRRGAAARFGVAISTVIEWVNAWRAEGRLIAKPMGGDHSSRLNEDRGWLLERVAAVPDLTLEEIRAELAARGKLVGYGTVWRFFAAEGISFKKNRARQRARAA
jgi:putative transposase